MTADVDLARLLGAVERAGAKMIIVGDDRQLDAVGPGGALTALCARHPEQVWTLSDNLRQSEPGERAALAQLRHGNVAVAVGWYARAGRIHPVAGRDRAVNAMVKAWAEDTGAGRETLMLAYRRDNVEALNQTARRLWEQAGLLSGPELVAPGGRRYRAGDRIITLAPGPHGAWVTSQAAHVTAVDPHTQQLTAVTPDGQQLHHGTRRHRRRASGPWLRHHRPPQPGLHRRCRPRPRRRRRTRTRLRGHEPSPEQTDL